MTTLEDQMARLWGGEYLQLLLKGGGQRKKKIHLLRTCQTTNMPARMKPWQCISAGIPPWMQTTLVTRQANMHRVEQKGEGLGGDEAESTFPSPLPPPPMYFRHPIRIED
jgi:hypothetical protein